MDTQLALIDDGAPLEEVLDPLDATDCRLAQRLATALAVPVDTLYVAGIPGFAAVHYADWVWCDIVDTTDRDDLTTVASEIRGQAAFIADHLRRGEFHTAFYAMQKPALWHAYQAWWDRLPVSVRYGLFVDMYQRCDAGHDQLNPQALRTIFDYAPVDPAYPRRRAAIDALAEAPGHPGAVTVYRGHFGRTMREPLEAVSWTKDPAVARWFAGRFGSGHVVSGLAAKRDIVDVLEDRHEAEVLVRPGCVAGVVIMEYVDGPTNLAPPD